MNCSICNKRIVLVPSAAERARRYGGRPQDYTRLFTAHAACTVAAREADARALMARTASAKQAQHI